MSEGELIATWFSCLTEDFRSQVMFRLNFKRQIRATNVPPQGEEGEAAPAIDNTLPFTISEVIQECGKMVNENKQVDAITSARSGTKSSGGSSFSNAGPTIKKEFEEMALSMALLKDKLVNSERQTNSKFEELQNTLTQTLQALQQKSNAGPTSQYTQQHRSNAPPSGECYLCKSPDHFIQQCPHKEQYLRTGKLVLDNGKLRMPDGSPLPRAPPGQTVKDAIDEYYAKLTTMSRAMQAEYLNVAPEPDKLDILINLMTKQQLVQANAAPHPQYVQSVPMHRKSPEEQARIRKEYKELMDELNPPARYEHNQYVHTRGGANTDYIAPQESEN